MTDLPNLISTPWIIAAVAVFQIKHLFADFILQNTWMAHGKEKPEGWLAPLSAHAGVHAALTTLIFVVLAPAYAWLGLVDFAIHFTIDRTKALLTRMFDANAAHTAFWWLIGIDQTLHHLTHLAYSVVLALAHTPR